MQVWDLIQDRIGDATIWNYEIIAPTSFEDVAVIRIIVRFGKTKAEYSQEYRFKMEEI